MILDRIDATEACRIAVGGMLDNAAAGGLACAEYADYAGVDFMTYDPGRPGHLDPKFLEFIELRARSLVREDAYAIADMVDDEGLITVYRAMVVPPGWRDEEHDGTGLGIYWAWSEDCAVSHHGSGYPGHIEVRLRGRVHVDDVDWTMTVGLNACDDYAVGTENEIRLLESARVTLERIEWRPDIFDEFVEYVPQRAPGPPRQVVQSPRDEECRSTGRPLRLAFTRSG